MPVSHGTRRSSVAVSHGSIDYDMTVSSSDGDMVSANLLQSAKFLSKLTKQGPVGGWIALPVCIMELRLIDMDRFHPNYCR